MNIVTNPHIKKELFDRWQKLGIRTSDVIRDANERNMNINASRMSRYKSGKSKEAITQYQLLWLCVRWGIPVTITIGRPMVINENGETVPGAKVKYVIPPYNELDCLNRLKLVFGNG